MGSLDHDPGAHLGVMKASKKIRETRYHDSSGELGANLAEYLVLLICLVVLSIVAVRALGPLNTPPFERASGGINNDGSAPGDGSGGGTGTEAVGGAQPEPGVGSGTDTDSQQ
jgi:hypothetical protein